MSTRVQWFVTAALLTAFVVGVHVLALQAERANAVEQRQLELDLALRRVATDWILHSQDLANELLDGLAPQTQRMRRAGLDELYENAPQSNRNYAVGAAFLLAFGAHPEAAGYADRIVEPTGETEPIKRVVAGEPCTWEEWKAAVDALALPERVRARLLAYWHAHNSSEEIAGSMFAELSSAEGRIRWRTHAAQIALLAAGVLGIIGLFALAPISFRLSRLYDGLSSPGPFASDPLRIWVAGFGFLAFSLAFAQLAAAAFPGAFTSSEAPAWIAFNTALTGLVGMGFAWATCGAGRGARPADFGLTLTPFRSGALGAVAWGVLAYCISVPVSAVTTLLSEVILGGAPQVTSPVIPVLAAASSLPDIALLITASVLLAPLFEEIMFRGFLYRAIRDLMGPFSAGLLVSAMFAAVHPSMHTALPLFALSAGLCFLYERTGSLWPSVIAHGINNAGALLWLTTSLASS